MIRRAIGESKIRAVIDQFRLWIWVMAALICHVMISVAMANSPDRKAHQETRRIAQQLAAEYSLAQAGGSDLSKINGVRTAVEQLAKGIPGRGRYSGLIFKVPNLTPVIADEASAYLTFDRRVLTYHQPIDFSAAWSSGSVAKARPPRGNSISKLLAERTAESYARVFEAARAGAANLSGASDVETSMKILEEGVTGQGSHQETVFRMTAPRKNIRFLAKKMLHFHDGALHFIRDLDKKAKAEILELIEQRRPAQLAQKIVALFDTASSVGVEFPDAVTPDDIIHSLRVGVHSTDQLGMQFFRISATGSESEWSQASAYLRLENGHLRYSPPKGSN